MRRWAESAETGSELSFWRHMKTSAPANFVVLDHGRCSLHELLDVMFWERSEAEGNRVGSWVDSLSESSSPSLHCAQNAVVATARQAASKWEERERYIDRACSIAIVTGIRGERLEERGVRL